MSSPSSALLTPVLLLWVTPHAAGHHRLLRLPVARGATVPAACQALGRALGLIPPARSTLALGPAL